MFIGGKQIKETRPANEKTAGGVEIAEVEYSDGDIEWFSTLMLDKIVSEKACDLTELRDKRVFPVVEVVLGILRDWGIKLNELQYLSAKLNNSLQINEFEALNELWGQFMPKPNSPDEVNLIAIDRVLKNKKVSLKDVLK